MHHVFERWEPWHGEPRTRPTGSLVADRRGDATGFAIAALQERGPCSFVRAWRSTRAWSSARTPCEDLDVNATKEKAHEQRSSTADELSDLIPLRLLSLEQALEFIRDDECVEVTPKSIRLRKVELSATKRQSITSRRKRDRDAGTLEQLGENDVATSQPREAGEVQVSIPQADSNQQPSGHAGCSAN